MPIWEQVFPVLQRVRAEKGLVLISALDATAPQAKRETSFARPEALPARNSANGQTSPCYMRVYP